MQSSVNPYLQIPFSNNLIIGEGLIIVFCNSFGGKMYKVRFRHSMTRQRIDIQTLATPMDFVDNKDY